MMNGQSITTSPQNRENLGNLKGGDSQFLGNGHLNIATMLLSYQAAHGRGYPYLAHVLPGLNQDTSGLAMGRRSFNTLSNPPEPPMTPQERQARNLDRTPAKSTVTESWPVLIAVGALAILVLSVGIHLSTGGTLNIGGR